MGIEPLRDTRLLYKIQALNRFTRNCVCLAGDAGLLSRAGKGMALLARKPA
jgi:hypothetical protein